MLKEAIRSLVNDAVYDRLRRAKQQRITRQFKSYVAEHRFGSTRLKVSIADPVGKEWYDADVEHLPEIKMLSRFDLAGRTVFDLGAHQCVVAMLLGKLVGETGKVIAVEANEHNHKVSLDNIALNAASNVSCIKGIVSSGKLEVSIDGGLNGRARKAGSATPKLEVLTIDGLSRSHGAPGLVFLDIEGHEIEALGAAIETLAVPGCHWFIELHGNAALADYGHKNSDIFRFFPESDFTWFIMDETSGRLSPLTRDDLPTDRCHVVFENRRPWSTFGR